jgi:UDP-2,3-diacylglucosamine pyrophosphatase LpxH
MKPLVMQSVLVLSDVHLGHERANFDQFDEFLDWMKALGDREPAKMTVTYNSEKRKLRYPDAIIFLGDILELWEPKNDDIGNVGKQTRKLLEKIIELPCNKIYVLGNHDKSLEELRAKVYTLPKGDFEIYYRHYPEKAEKDVLTVGNQRYFFIHGHQFDRDIRCFGRLGEVGPSIFLSLQRINKQLFRLHGFGSSLLALLLFCLYKYFGLWKFDALIPYAVAFLCPFWGTNLIWRTLRPLARRCFIARDKSIQSIIQSGWYDAAKDTIAAENLVFAHTHCPGILKVPLSGKLVKEKNLFVNTGSWFSKEKIENTFVYIDEKNIFLLKWEKERPEVLISYEIDSGDPCCIRSCKGNP